MKNLYELKDLEFSYSLDSHEVKALDGLSLEIPRNSLIAILGPSGSGKSTLLNILGLIEPVQAGSMLFQKEDISKVVEKEKNEIRKFKIGFIFQHFHLIPVLTAEENVAYFLNRQGLSEKEKKNRVKEALESVGLWEHRKKKPLQMSGGQRQRVAIARAIAKKPDVIIGDEVTANLDQKNGREIMKIFAELVKKHNVTVILSTHDPMVPEFANQCFYIQDGKLREE